MKSYPCERCRLRRAAERKPNGLIGRFWRWHTRWCPGWKAYQKHLAESGRLPGPIESTD
jgi:hypothetical protein